MQARMKNPVMIIPEALQALFAVNKAIETGGLSPVTAKLVQLRASQINGCGLCVDMHARELRQMGESEERVFAVGAWRDTPYFTEAERAALALTEATTRLSDQSDPVPDALWQEVTAHFDERTLAALIFNIAMINFWNRLNVPTRQVAGEWRKSAEAKKLIEEHAHA